MTLTDFFAIFSEPLWCLACVGLFLCTTLWYMLAYTRLAFPKKKRRAQGTPEYKPVSILLCVRNEYDRLSQLLPLLLEQEYDAPYEVVVVDKNSEDDTDILMAPLAQKYPNLVIRKLNADLKFGQDSSMALGVGIRAAALEYVLLMRPDCMPTGKFWLKSFMEGFPQKPATRVMLGHAAYRSSSHFIRNDLLEQDLHFYSMARKGLAYAGNGSPAVFQRSLFFDVHGFDSRLTDRHLYGQALMGHIITSANTTVCTHPQGTLMTIRRIRSQEWNQWRRRQMHTLSLIKGWRYAFLTAHKTLVGLFYLCWAFTLYLLLRYGFSLTLLPSLGVLTAVLLLRWTMLCIHYSGYRRNLREIRLWYSAPLWDVCAPAIHWYLLLSSFIRKK